MPLLSNDPQPDNIEKIIEKRDRLADQLEANKVPGVISVGITKIKGQVKLMVAVKANFNESIPECFEETGVIVRCFEDATGFQFLSEEG